MDENLKKDLIQRIMSVVKAEEVYLFGSTARHKADSNSDLDICIIIPDHLKPRDITRAIYRALYGFSRPVDIVTVNRKKWNEGKNKEGFIYSQINKDKIKLYAA